jgi:hypothetical protein
MEITKAFKIHFAEALAEPSAGAVLCEAAGEEAEERDKKAEGNT